MHCTRIPERANDGLQYAFPTSSPTVVNDGISTPLALPRPPRLPSHCLTPSHRLKKTKHTVIGKAEGHDTDWHGHITAVTVAPEYRRLAIAGNLCKRLERISEEPYRGFFVDLYVRRSNDVAIGMYERMGYSVFRCVRDYYANLGPGMAGSEDAYGQCSFAVQVLDPALFSCFSVLVPPPLTPKRWQICASPSRGTHFGNQCARMEGRL